MLNKLLTILISVLFFTRAFADSDNYDYIVVGSGSAGGVIAGRLSEDPNIKVLLIERGTEVSNGEFIIVRGANDVVSFTTNNIGITNVSPLTLSATEVFHTDERNMAAPETTSVCPRALGGGPAVSGSFWGRIPKDTANEWAASLGDSRLNYTNLALKMMDTENVLTSDSSYSLRGRNGPIEIYFHSNNDTNAATYVQSFSNFFGVPVQQDYSESLRGVAPMQRSLKRSSCGLNSGICQRQSPYHTYVQPFIANRTNLRVVSLAQVLKVNLRVDGGVIKARGVDYLDSNLDLVRAKAKEEVILSAGAYNSPKILMLSGIGPADHLTEMGIPVIKNITEVGKNLVDHFYTFFVGYNPFGASVTQPTSIQIGFVASGLHGTNIDMEIAWQLLPPTYFNLPAGSPGHAMVVVPVQVRNTSAGGFVRLQSKNPFDKLNVSLGFDFSRIGPFVWAFKQIRSWMANNSIIEAFPGTNPVPNGVPTGASDSDIAAYLLSKGQGYYHMQSSCAMGKVVDTEFKVYGVEKLRVVDNSVTPTVAMTPTHPSSAASTFGELAADYILNDYYNH